MIVLDASVLIGFLFNQDAHHEAAVTLLRDAADNSIGVSQVTLAEALVVPTRLRRAEAAQHMLADIGITEIPLPHDAAVQLARLRVDSGLKMPHCCVLLAAMTSNGAVATFDSRLASVATARGIPTLMS